MYACPRLSASIRTCSRLSARLHATPLGAHSCLRWRRLSRSHPRPPLPLVELRGAEAVPGSLPGRWLRRRRARYRGGRRQRPHDAPAPRRRRGGGALGYAAPGPREGAAQAGAIYTYGHLHRAAARLRRGSTRCSGACAGSGFPALRGLGVRARGLAGWGFAGVEVGGWGYGRLPVPLPLAPPPIRIFCSCPAHSAAAPSLWRGTEMGLHRPPAANHGWLGGADWLRCTA